MNVQGSESAPPGVVGRLMQINKKAKNKHLEHKYYANQEIEALKSLKTKLTNLQVAVKKMDETDDFLTRKTSTTITENPIVLSTASANTLLGDYKFQIVALATETNRAGATNIGADLSATSDVSGVTLNTMPLASSLTMGTFTIDGKRIEIRTAGETADPTADASIESTDSLEALFTAISTATGGDVTASYNPTTDKIELASASEIKVGTAADTSNFLTAAKLIGNGTGAVSSENALGAIKISSSIANSNLETAVTNGSFKVNGVSFTYDKDADSLDSIMQQINASDAGVSISYDSINDKFSLTSKSTGSLDVSVEDTSGNLLEVMGLNSTATLTLGTNAQFKINDGATLNSTSNILDANVHGIPGLAVTAKKVGTDTVTVAQDGSSSKEKLDDFISKYNDIQSFLKIKTEITSSSKGPLHGNNEVKTLKRDLRSLISSAVTSLGGGEIKRLVDIGIDHVSDSNELEVKDASLLDEALTKKSITISTLFTDSTDGFSKSFNDFLDNALSTSNNTLYGQRILSLEAKMTKYDEKIAKIDEDYEKTMREMEIAQGRVQQAQQEMMRQMQFIQNL